MLLERAITYAISLVFSAEHVLKIDTFTRKRELLIILANRFGGFGASSFNFLLVRGMVHVS